MYNEIVASRETKNLRIWRNWQTRTVQVRVRATSWRFESSYPHQKKLRAFALSFFLSDNSCRQKEKVQQIGYGARSGKS